MTKEEKRYQIIAALAETLKTELLTEHIVHAPDFDGIAPEEQMMTKICVLTGACEMIVRAGEILAERLGAALTQKEHDDIMDKAIEATTEEKKEWN